MNEEFSNVLRYIQDSFLSLVTLSLSEAGPGRSVCLVTLSLSKAGPGRFGRQISVTQTSTIPYHTMLAVKASTVPVTPIHPPVPVQVGVGFGGPVVRCCGGGAAAVGLCGAPCEAGDVGAAAVAVAAARLA